MQRVTNDWNILPDRTDLVIQSAKTGQIIASLYGINNDTINKLRHLRWCYESSKGHIYATDLSAEVPKLLNCGTHKVYLWKYLAYLLTGKVTTAWIRNDLLVFKVGDGILVDTNGDRIPWW